MIKLTQYGKPVWLNTNNICSIQEENNDVRTIKMISSDYFYIKESSEQILEMLKIEKNKE